MKDRMFILIVLAVLSGVAIACATKAMPPVGVVDVSPADLAQAAEEGYTNPARAAGLKNLDKKAKALVGDSNWKRDTYHGHVTYKVKTGYYGPASSAIVYEEKPCGQNAVDTVASSGGGGGGGGGGGSGGGSGGVGGGAPPWPGCIYNCDKWGEIGDVTPV